MRLKYLVNRILKGLVSDIDKSLFPNDSAYKLENAQLLNKDGNDFVVTTMRGNRKYFSLPDGLVPIDFKLYDNILYVVSYSDVEIEGETRRVYEVGSYPSSKKLVAINNPNTNDIHDFVQIFVEDSSAEGLENIYKPIPMAKKLINGTMYLMGFTVLVEEMFNKDYINILPRKSYDESVDLFICDGNNYNRTINNGFTRKKILKDRLPEYDNTFRTHDVLTRQFLRINKPIHSTFEVEQGGKLRYGRLFFYIRYLDASFNPTNWFPMEGPVQIAYGSKYYDIHGGDPENDIPTDKQVKFSLSNIDVAFKYFEIGVFYERGQASATPPVKKAYLISNRYTIDGEEKELLITGREDEGVLTPEELITPPTKETISLSQTELNNRWFGANWKRKKFEISFDDEISDYAIDHYYYRDVNKFIKEFAKLCYVTPTYDSGHDDMVEDYNDPYGYSRIDPIRSQNYKYPGTYKPGDIVAFSIVGLLDDGTFTKPYPITGFNNYKTLNNNGSEYDINYYVANYGGDWNYSLGPYLADDNTTNKGLFQFPSGHQPWYDPDGDGVPTQYDMHDSSIAQAKRSMGINLHMTEAYHRLFGCSHYADKISNMGIKAFYLVRHIPDENFMYSGLNLTGMCRAYIGLNRDGGNEGDPFWKYYIYFNQLRASAYFRDRHPHWEHYCQPLIEEDSSWWDALFSSNMDGDTIKLMRNVAKYFPLTHSKSILYFKAGTDTLLTPDDKGTISCSLHEEKGYYGLFSDDFIFNKDRTKINHGGIHWIVKMGQPYDTEEHLPPIGSRYAFRAMGLIGGGYKKTLVFPVDANKQKGLFFSAMGDQLLSSDLTASIYDTDIVDEIQDTLLSIDGGIFFGNVVLNLDNFSVDPPESLRSPEVRTSPYLGLKLNGIEGNEVYSDMRCWDEQQNALLYLFKKDPRQLYEKVLSEFNNEENKSYSLCSKAIEIDEINPPHVTYNGTSMDDGYGSLGTSLHLTDLNLYNGQSFLIRSYIKTKYTNLFTDDYTGSGYDLKNDGTIFQGDTESSMGHIIRYVQKNSQLVTFPSYTMNNIHMQGYRDNKFYPYTLVKRDEKRAFKKGVLREKNSVGFNDILDASYNRSVFPNEFLMYPDYYKDEYDFQGRVRPSPKYHEGSYLDAWRSIPLKQYVDFSLALGFITGILNVLGRLVLVHTDGIFQLFSDQREVKQSETGTELTLGVGGILEENRRPLSDKYGSELSVFESGSVGAYGVSMKHNVFWQIKLVEGGQLSVVNLLQQHKLEDKFRKAIDVLGSDFDNVSGILSQKIEMGYSQSEKSLYVSIFKREVRQTAWVPGDNNTIRIYADTDDFCIMGKDHLFLNFGNGYESYPIETLGKDYVEIDCDNKGLPPLPTSVYIFCDNGETFVYDEVYKYFRTTTNTPDHWISGEDIMDVKRSPIDLNGGEIPLNDIYIHDKEANENEFFEIIHEMRVGIIINGNGTEEGIGSIQKMFMATRVTSDEMEFIRSEFATEFQKTGLFPFIDEMRFWMLPEYAENRWELNIPVQESNEDNGYETEAQMRGLWLMMEFHYRGNMKKYIKDFVTKVSPSFA